jgi:ankyrin repeat protein/GR25 family glycosyltransferase involved in LPS biosynthesis/mannosyltransferase OCH1-like enzyme
MTNQVSLNNSSNQNQNTTECYFDKGAAMYEQNAIDYQTINAQLMVKARQALENLEQDFEKLVLSGSKIPLVTQQVYFTNLDKPKKIDGAALSISIASLIELNRAMKAINEKWGTNFKWTHNIYTNLADAVPDELKNIDNVMIKDVNAYQDHSLWLSIQKAVNQRFYAQASDLMRYAVLDREGGLYRDLDNKIFDNRGEHVIKLVFVATMLAGKETEDNYAYLGNSLIAAVPSHPAIKKVIESALVNLDEEHPENIAEYIKYACTKHYKIVYQTGPVALTMAIFKEANHEGYNDLVMPRLVFYNSGYVRSITPQSRCYNPNLGIKIDGVSEGVQITSDSGDLWCGSWYFENNATDIIDYGSNVSSLAYREHHLFQGAISGNLQEVIKYSSNGENIDTLSKSGITPLFVATSQNFIPIIEYLLKKAANPNFAAQDGTTALHIAVQTNSAKAVELLLKANADPNIKNVKGVSPLVIAVLKGDVNIIKQLMDHGADKQIEFLGTNLQDLAAKMGKPEIVELLKQEQSQKQIIECHFGRTKDMFVQEGIDFDSLHKNFMVSSLTHLSIMDRLAVVTGKIPLITHQIYFFGYNEEAVIDKVSLRTSVETLSDLNANDDNWEHYIWTDNPDKIPQQLKNLDNLQVKDFREFKDNPLKALLNQKLQQAKNDKGLYAQASDIARYMILFNYGGVYRDFDYKIYNVVNLRKLMAVSNILIGKEEYNDFSIGNSFIAVTPYHDVIKTLQDLVQRNLGPDQESIPNYVKYACLKADKILYQTGPVALTMAFYKSANKKGSIDLLMPREILYNREYLKANSPDSKCYQPNDKASLEVSYGSIKAQTIGADPFCDQQSDDYLLKIQNYGDEVSSENFRNARIFQSIMTENVPVLEYDLSNIETPDIKNNLGITPLFLASFLGKKEMVKILLKHGADPYFLNNGGATAIKIAKDKGFNEIVKLLEKSQDDSSKDVSNISYSKGFDDSQYLYHSILNQAIIANDLNKVDQMLDNYSFNNFNLFYDTPHMAAYLRGTNSSMYNLVFHKYWQFLENYRNSAIDGALENFEVVVARYNEDLSWIVKEFGEHTKVTVYNKGKDNLEYLPDSYNIVPLPNVGVEVHTYLTHIINNYDNLADRVFFTQGLPYDNAVLLPLLEYQRGSIPACTNIRGKCLPISIDEVQEYFINYDWNTRDNGKYKNCAGQNGTMKDFFYNFVDKENYTDPLLLAYYGAIFSVEKDKIRLNGKEYYQTMLPVFNKFSPIEGHFIERSWNNIFQKRAKFSVINLDIAKDRLEKFTNNLNSLGMQFERFSAVNGSTLSIYDFQNNRSFLSADYKKALEEKPFQDFNITCRSSNDKAYNVTFSTEYKRWLPGEFGLWCSNILLWHEAVEKNYQNIVIFEDDAKIQSMNFKTEFDQFLNSLPYDYDVAFLDVIPRHGQLNEVIGKPLVLEPSPGFVGWATLAVMISNNGLKKLLSYEKISGPLDVFYWNNSKKNLGAVDNAFNIYVAANNKLITTEAQETYIQSDAIVSREYDKFKEYGYKNMKNQPKAETLQLKEALLFEAAVKGNAQLVKSLAAEGVDVNTKSKPIPAILAAVIYGHEEVVKILLKNGADPNYTTKENLSLLKIVIDQKKIGLLAALLEAGANIEAKIDGLTPLQKAKQMNFVEGYQLIKKQQEKFIIYNISKNNISTLRQLLDSSSLNDLLADTGKTALCLAAQLNKPEIASLLIDLGADINLGNPLFISAALGHTDITKILVKAGANIEQYLGLETPIHAAVSHSKEKDVEILLANNAIVNADTLQNPLYLSAFLRLKDDVSARIYDKILNYYWDWLEQNRDQYIPTNSNRSLEVVVVRFDEDLNWIEKEFPQNIKVTIYNKGLDDLDYLGDKYQIVKSPNVGWFGGTILLHIANNYYQLYDRTLYVQGNPYEQGIHTPMVRYLGDVPSICTNILAKCEPRILIEESNKLKNYTPEKWAATKYNKFSPLNYTMVDFFHKWVDPEFPVDKSFMVDIGSQFAVDRDKIHEHPQEHYAAMLPDFNETYATADFCFEKAVDPLFGSKVFNYSLSGIKDLKITNPSLDRLLLEAVINKNHLAMQNLIEAGANVNYLVKTDESSAYSLLFLALNHQDYKAMELLINAGVNIDHVNFKGLSTMALAVLKGDVEGVKILHQGGAKLTQKLNDHTLIDIATKEGNYQVLDYLKKHNVYDMAYVVNLEHAYGRKLKFVPQLELAKINYKILKAVDGNKIQLVNMKNGDIFSAMDLKNKAKKSFDSDLHSVVCNPNEAKTYTLFYQGKLLKKPGKYGQLCSYAIVMQDAKANNYSNIVVFADDVSININEANTYINSFIAHMPDSYDIGFLDYVPRKGNEITLPGNNHYKILSENFFAWGSHAMVLSSNGYNKLAQIQVYSGDIDSTIWSLAKNNNVNSSAINSKLEIYKAFRNDIVELQPGYSYIDNMEVNFNLKDLPKQSENELITAVRNGNFDHVRYLVEIGYPTNIKTKDGGGLLHLAAEAGNILLIDYLIKEGLNPDEKNIYGVTPLAVAAVNGHLEAVKLLKGLKVDDTLKFQGKTLTEIVRAQNNTLMSMLINYEMPIANNANYVNILLFHACEKGSLDQVKRYIEIGADVNFNVGNTPLIAATINNNVEIVQYLLENKADPNLLHPVYFSALNGNSKITKLLLDYGADPNMVNSLGDFPLRQAVNKGYFEDVKYLVEAGAQIQFDGMHTPLFEASYYKDRNKAGVAIYELLISEYFKWLEKELQVMEPIKSNGTFEVVIARYKEDLNWIFKEFDLNTNITIYNKGPNDLHHLKGNCSFYESHFDSQTNITSFDLVSSETNNTNCQVVKIPNMGWFGGTLIYHMYNRYDSLADRTFFAQGFPYDQELYLPIVRYKSYLPSGCKNFVGKCINSTLIQQSDIIEKTPNEVWAKSRYPNFTPPAPGETMVKYCKNVIDPNLAVNKPLYINLGAQSAIDKHKIQVHSKEFYGELYARDFNLTYATRDFFLEKCWDPFFQEEGTDYYANESFYMA